MNQDTEPYLTDKLKFWLVKPNIGIGGVSGLETLLSGAYIQVDGGEEVLDGNSTRYFEALVGAPPVDIAEGLLVYKLVTSNASGVSKGALIYHRNIPVGKVYDVQLSDDHQSVELIVAVEPKYKGLVKRSSRFWNVSGVKAAFDLSGVKIETSSLAAMMVGGIAFSSPDSSGEAAEGSLFRLYPSADAARDSLEVKLHFTADADVRVGTPIYYNEQKVGQLHSLDWLDDFSGLDGKAKMSMDMAPLMKTDTQFWLDTPSISMEGIDVGHMLQGAVIRILPGKTGSKTEFNVLNQSPYDRFAEQGLHFNLISQDAYGLSKGSGIYYKSQPIGQVLWVDFDIEKQHFNMDVLIFPRFRQMVTQDSQFYNLSGVDFKANLQQVSLQVPSFGQLLSGGIGVHIPNERAQVLATQSELALHNNLATAIAATSIDSVDLVLTSSHLYSPALDTPLYYQSFKIGQVSKVSLDSDGAQTRIELKLEPQYRHLVRQNSRFWQLGAVDLSANIRGVKLRTAPLMAMLAGGIAISPVDQYSADIAEKGASFALFDSYSASEETVTFVDLTILKHTNLAVGAVVNYRGYAVGEVTEVKLLTDLSGVNAKIKLKNEFAEHFTRQSSRYWLVQPQVNLTGIKNVTASVLGDHLAVAKGEGARRYDFEVAENNVTDKSGLAITLHADQLGSLDVGKPLLFKQLRIGEIIDVGLTVDSVKVSVKLLVYPQYRHLITQNSRFWNASGSRLMLVYSLG